MTRDIRHRQGLHAADQKFLSQIETYGWNVTTVFKKEGETGPEWAFSAGLFHSYQHPEIAMFGLDLDIMHKIVNDIGTEDDQLIGELVRRATSIAKDRKISSFRTVFNTNREAGQSVFHIHLHLLGGRPMHWPPG